MPAVNALESNKWFCGCQLTGVSACICRSLLYLVLGHGHPKDAYVRGWSAHRKESTWLCRNLSSFPAHGTLISLYEHRPSNLSRLIRSQICRFYVPKGGASPLPRFLPCCWSYKHLFYWQSPLNACVSLFACKFSFAIEKKYKRLKGLVKLAECRAKQYPGKLDRYVIEISSHNVSCRFLLPFSKPR